jgi:CHAT domain-containing protein/Tfp pilus assembly protein PilF
MSHQINHMRLVKISVSKRILLWLLFIALPVSGQNQKPGHAQNLMLKQSIERELKGDEAHSYSITLSAGQYLYVVIDQRGIDVVVTLFAPDGRKLAEVDSPYGTRGLEPIWAITEDSGTYQLEIRPSKKDSKPGRYEAKIEELRIASEKDKKRVAAEWITMDAERLFAQDNEASLRKAVTKFEESLQMRRAAGDQPGEVRTLNSIGGTYMSLNENQKAIEYFNQALIVCRKAGDHTNEAMTLKNIGAIQNKLGEKQKAIEYFNQALAIIQTLPNRSDEATTFYNIGKVYYSMGDTQKTLEYYNKALSASKAIDDLSDQSGILHNIADVHYELGNKRMALDYYKQALSITPASQGQLTKAVTLVNIGLVYGDLGEMEKALEYFEQALPIFKVEGHRCGQAWTLNDIGLAYKSLGETQKALELYKQALVIFQAEQVASGESVMLTNIGQIYASRDEDRKAIQYYEQALPIMEKIEDHRARGALLASLGAAYNSLGETQKALEYYNKSLSESRAAGDRAGEGITLMHIGSISNTLGENEKAVDYFYQALPILRVAGDRLAEAKALYALGYVYDSQNNPNLTTFLGKQAVNILQQLRSDTQGLDREIQKTYLKSMEQAYRRLTELLITQGRYGEALEVLNAFKDQQFFDFDQTSQAKLKPLTRTPREAEFVQRYEKSGDALGIVGGQLAELKRKLGSRPPNAEESNQLRQFKAQLKTASDEFSAFFKQAQSEFSRSADDKDNSGEIINVVQIQATLRELSQKNGQQAVAIYTLAGERKFHSLLVTMDSMTAVSTPIKGTELNTKARQLWALLQSDKYDPTILSNELYNIIFKPIESKLPKNTRTIMWSLDENLRYLPMTALFDGKQYLVERYNNVVFTRADKERMTRAVSPQWTGVGFGTSRPADVKHLETLYRFNALPNVTAELNAVFKTRESRSGVFSGDTFPDASFTREAMLAALKQHRPLVHIASHFKFAPGNEAKSFLLLGDETVFSLNEMKQYGDLFQGVELLTLSACETAVQRADSVDREIDAFAELAQRLGAGAVMATLWKVRDDSSYLLMRDFYQRKQDVRKETKAESLRQAQLALLNGSAKVTVLPQAENVQAKRSGGESAAITILAEGNSMPANPEAYMVYIEAKYARAYKHNPARPYAHPYYWSPFVLFGNWR